MMRSLFSFSVSAFVFGRFSLASRLTGRVAHPRSLHSVFSVQFFSASAFAPPVKRLRSAIGHPRGARAASPQSESQIQRRRIQTNNKPCSCCRPGCAVGVCSRKDPQENPERDDRTSDDRDEQLKSYDWNSGLIHACQNHCCPFLADRCAVLARRSANILYSRQESSLRGPNWQSSRPEQDSLGRTRASRF
jgi:hypothetical protein